MARRSLAADRPLTRPVAWKRNSPVRGVAKPLAPLKPLKWCEPVHTRHKRASASSSIYKVTAGGKHDSHQNAGWEIDCCHLPARYKLQHGLGVRSRPVSAEDAEAWSLRPQERRGKLRGGGNAAAWAGPGMTKAPATREAEEVGA